MNLRNGIAIWMLALAPHVASAAIDSCKIKVAKSGALSISAGPVNGTLQHDADGDGLFEPFYNGATCVVYGQARTCTLGAPTSLEARTPPADCALQLRDDDGVFVCPHYKGCVVGLRDGALGPVGPTGPIGPSGPMGQMGPMGPMGLMGLMGLMGPQGARGATGETGAQGPQGIAGPTGATGVKGSPGPTGPQGPAGPGSIIGGFTMQFSEDDRLGWNQIANAGDESCRLNIPLGFTFTGFGADTTTVSVSSNGILFFGADCIGPATNGTLPSDISNDAMFFYLWDDLVDASANEFIEYITLGSAGGRVFNMYVQTRFLNPLCGTSNMKIMVSVHEGSNLVKASYKPGSNNVCHRGGQATFGLQTTGGAAATAFMVGFNATILDDDGAAQVISFHPPR